MNVVHVTTEYVVIKFRLTWFLLSQNISSQITYSWSEYKDDAIKLL